MLHSNLQILEKKTKNIFEYGHRFFVKLPERGLIFLGLTVVGNIFFVNSLFLNSIFTVFGLCWGVWVQRHAGVWRSCQNFKRGEWHRNLHNYCGLNIVEFFKKWNMEYCLWNFVEKNEDIGSVRGLRYTGQVWPALNPVPDDKILDRSKLKQSADDNIKFDENSRKFSKQVENTVGKGEIACYEQFLLFVQQGFAQKSNPLGQMAHWAWKMWAISENMGP